MSDKAERLHSLIRSVEKVSREIHVINYNGHQYLAQDLPLWESLGPIAETLRYSDYGEFRDSFLTVCHTLISDIQTLSLQKESVRQNWISCIKQISRVFDATNFASRTSTVFEEHFSVRNLEIVDSISERFQNYGIRESTIDELEDALSAVRDVINAFESSGKLDKRISLVLLHYLQQMESVFSHVDDLGDEIFWKTYKEVFATFIQLHNVIAEMENAEELKSKIRVVADKLTSRSIAGVSLVANIATIGTAIIPLLSNS